VLQALQLPFPAPVQPSQDGSQAVHVLPFRKWVSLHSEHSEIKAPVHLVQAASHVLQVVAPS
jgi:hypothetical protein